MKADLGIPAHARRQSVRAPGDAARTSRRWSRSRVTDTCHLTNPRQCTREDFERIFAEAM